MKKTLLLILLLVMSGANQAATMYVTDQFKITMRSGESSGHRILRMLPTGEAVTVLKSNPESGYSQIKVKDGKTGYVLTRQLLKEPTARDQMARLEQRIKELEATPGELQAKLSALSEEHDVLVKSNQALQLDRDIIADELSTLKRTSANAVRIANERKDLRKQVASMTREIENLKQENREMSNSSNQRWFMIGGGVIIAGILLGLILPHLRIRRRKDSWGSL